MCASHIFGSQTLLVGHVYEVFCSVLNVLKVTTETYFLSSTSTSVQMCTCVIFCVHVCARLRVHVHSFARVYVVVHTEG